MATETLYTKVNLYFETRPKFSSLFISELLIGPQVTENVRNGIFMNIISTLPTQFGSQNSTYIHMFHIYNVIIIWLKRQLCFFAKGLPAKVYTWQHYYCI